MSSGMEDYWLLEGVIGYLKGPIWTNPIQHFMEQNCYVFGLSEYEEQEAEEVEECKKIHKKYKELVDCLLNTFLKDISCTHEQFIKICDRSKLSKHPAYLESLEQIWAADNYELFKSTMCRKNSELELQALVLLQCQLGLLNDLIDNDDQIMSIVIQRSKDEYERRNTNVSTEEYKIAREIADSKEAVKQLKKEVENQEDINKKVLEMSLNDEKQSKIRSELPVRPPSSRLRQQQQVPLQASNVNNQRMASAKTFKNVPIDEQNFKNKAASNKLNDEVEDRPEVPLNAAQEYLIKTDENMSNSELERRAEFMRKQRELLIERKRIEREKQLDNMSEKQQEARPMSSRLARAVLDGVEPSAMGGNKSKQTSGGVDDEKERKKLEARRALAEKLKKEVINSSSKKINNRD